jgi:hypothetical protein
MSGLSDDDYYTLDAFVRAVLTRVNNGRCSVSEGCSDIMHPLTAWDKGNWQEFGPWMELKIDSWSTDDS